MTELTIRGCREPDSGRITLTAANAEGTDEAEATLTVRGS